MTKTKLSSSWRLMLGSALMIASAAGCASVSTTSTQTAGATPTRVEDCGLVAISSPSRFACNGKTYTTFQIAKARLAEEKKNAGK